MSGDVLVHYYLRLLTSVSIFVLLFHFLPHNNNTKYEQITKYYLQLIRNLHTKSCTVCWYIINSNYFEVTMSTSTSTSHNVTVILLLAFFLVYIILVTEHQTQYLVSDERDCTCNLNQVLLRDMLFQYCNTLQLSVPL